MKLLFINQLLIENVFRIVL